jgi:hypothetical protein
VRTSHRSEIQIESLTEREEAARLQGSRPPAACRSKRWVQPISATGAACIAVGALTKHVRAVDLSMRLEFGRGESA